MTEEILFDPRDAELVGQYNWRIERQPDGRAYAQATTHGKGRKTIRMHRLIMGDPVGKVIDHINGNGR